MNKGIAAQLLCILCLFSACTASYMRTYEKGLSDFDNKEYEFAIQQFQQSLEEAKESSKAEKQFFADANYHVAEGYRRSNRIHDALDYYKNAIDLNVENDEARFWYAYALKADGNYEGAKSQFEKYISEGQSFDLINRAKNEIENLKELEKLANKPHYYEITNLGELNTDKTEYSPMFINDRFFFTSDRESNMIYAQTGAGFHDIYEYVKDGPDTWTGQAKILPEVLNTENAHEATPTFSNNGKVMYFSRSNTGKRKGAQDVNLFMSKMENGQWAEPTLMAISDENSFDTSPLLSPDGKTLYFASNREGGYGGIDLYKSTLTEEGVWGNVENLGTPINTRGNDMFPFVDKKGNFYYSSDGHPSFGKLDLFKVEESEEGELEIVNMGRPLNSPYDDFSIYVEDSITGYFSSDRPDDGAKGGDDIFMYHLDFKVTYIVDIKTFGRTPEDSTFKLSDVTVSVIDEEGDTTIFRSDEEGLVLFEGSAEKSYTVYGSKEEYFDSEEEEFTVKGVPRNELQPGDTVRQDIAVELVLSQKKEQMVFLIPILYPFDQAVITDSSKAELDKVVTFLKKNPEVSVELSSHTDFRGSLEYNRRLSQRRADSAVHYIVSQGIDPQKITARGYGEEQPKIVRDSALIAEICQCEDVPDEQVMSESFIKGLRSEEQRELAHQINRRTEFTITGIDNVTYKDR